MEVEKNNKYIKSVRKQVYIWIKYKKLGGERVFVFDDIKHRWKHGFDLIYKRFKKEPLKCSLTNEYQLLGLDLMCWASSLLRHDRRNTGAIQL